MQQLLTHAINKCNIARRRKDRNHMIFSVDAKKPLIKFLTPGETRNKRWNLLQHNTGYKPETKSQSKEAIDISFEIKKKTIAPTVSMFLHGLCRKSQDSER